MEGRGGEGDEKKPRLSDVWGEKLRLIDINEEDDGHFLIDFPSLDSVQDFRPSVTYDNYNELEEFKNSDNHRAKLDLKNDLIFPTSDPSDDEPPRRPSYLRKSLAWNDAFFTSAGVLDFHELTLINNGLKADSDTKKRDTKSTKNGKGFSSSATRMQKISPQPKTKLKQNFDDKTTLQRSEKRDIKLSRSCDRMKSEETAKSASWITFDLKKSKKAAIFNESGKHAMLSKKHMSSSVSYDDVPSRYLSFPKSSASPKTRTPVSSASYDASSSFYRFTASKSDPRSKLFGSGSLSRTPPLGQTKKSQPQMENSRSTSPNVMRRKSSLSMQSVKMNPLITPVKAEEDIMDSISGPVTIDSRKRLKPSGLRQPLPRIGFFDEGKTTTADARLGIQLQFQKEISPLSSEKTPENLRLAKSAAMKGSSSNKSRQNACHEGGVRRSFEKLKTRFSKENNGMLVMEEKQGSCGEMEKEINDLSKCFETIGLDNESNVDSKTTPPKTTRSPPAHKVTDNLPDPRTPLVDKNALYSRVKSLPFTGKSPRSKVNSKASSGVNGTPSPVLAKENSSPGL